MSKPIKTDVGEIARYILHIRGTRVILDSDLARIYGVQTKRLNEQVKRNKDRFPSDFMFRLTDDEVSEVVAICDHLKKLKFSSYNPFAFTEHGALMLSAVLNTPAAVETGLYIVLAFVKIRTMLATHSKLEKKITEMENKYDKQFAIVFEALKLLIRQDQVSGLKSQVSSPICLTSGCGMRGVGSWMLVSGICHPASGIRYLVSGIRYPASST